MIDFIEVWLNAFIPGDAAGTVTVANGIHAGKRAFRGPAFDYFLTDNRGFDPAMNASSRMQSRARVVFDYAYTDEAVRLQNRCDATIKIESGSGRVTSNSAASTSGMKAASVTGECQSDRRLAIQFRLVGSASNPCLPGATDSDWNVAVSAYRSADLNSATVEVSGLVEPFPAFEMYARAPNRSPERLFAVMPAPGATPFDLFGGPTRNVGGTASL